MADQAVLKRVVVTLRLEPDMELEASEKACAVALAMNMSPDKVDEVRMAVVEACINAIEHSQADDRSLRLEISVLGDQEPQVLRITVQDRGVGFEPRKLVQPKVGGKLEAPHKRGWGLRIIEGLMDSVRVDSTAEGTSVTMSKGL